MKQNTVLVTGGAGFFGEILVKELLSRGYKCVSIDLEPASFKHKSLVSVKGDMCDMQLLEKLAKKYKFSAIFHLGAILAHAVKDKDHLWKNNIDGTRNVAELARKYKISKIVFTSSNCLWGKSFDRPVREDDEPHPVEVYGRSKQESEKILAEYTDINVVSFRCPTIIDAGRLGLLAILFEFMDEDRKVWVVGGGDNKYQFIYAPDLADACIKALDYNKSTLFNIGSDNVKTFKEVYEYVIRRAGTKARVANMPRKLVIPLMKLAYFLKLSPLGPYQYKMIAENFVFDTSKVKNELAWKPTLTNEEMLYQAYEYYHKNRRDIESRTDVSAHKQAPKMGVIRILKWLS